MGKAQAKEKPSCKLQTAVPIRPASVEKAYDGTDAKPQSAQAQRAFLFIQCLSVFGSQARRIRHGVLTAITMLHPVCARVVAHQDSARPGACVYTDCKGQRNASCERLEHVL